ncbi:ATP-dependent protease ATPase subunit HslU [Minwuia thermotolerans]|uniref:ATP-dependent protease ATPase subunit HslU n=1 Tax=Minwuia thermotolerans TaxID=2056226 RepID=A0A2M9G4C3_9PROT|nr:ATP-dependent protease ATPase subunit HslU [Minwuia thermotolerans]PJK30561.1 HslU--HslV peptidase ATPase subunit [Minwuia thermotolerans]
MANFSPREIVHELDRFIIGQNEAKRAVAVALRNRWRRQQLPEDLREEVLPKNILMIGPTGVGKTEISRRLAKLAEAPFIKVEATKFTEVGYVGRDVEQMIRDLVEMALVMVRERRRREVKARAELAAEERVLDALVGESASRDTREKFRQKLRNGELDDKEIELQVQDQGGMNLPTFDIPGQPGAQMGMLNLNDMFGKMMGGRTKPRRMTVDESHEILIAEESDKLLDEETLTAEAISSVENNGIVFLDEIDKITARSDRQGADVSREGVQRDLLPLIEGTTVSTKHGAVKTDHILFIASGAFHIAKPSDLLPELQGRLPIRVELKPLTKNDFQRILTETEASLIRQYTALMATEEVTLEFTDDAIETLADLAVQVNDSVENIGARRLHTIMEKLLEEVSFTASDRAGETVHIDAAYVKDKVSELAEDADLSKFIL